MWQSRSLGPVALAVGVISILVALGGHLLRQANPGAAAASVMIGAGWVVGGLAMTCAAFFTRRDLDRRRLLSGKGLIARWHVSPADWALFLLVDEAWAPGGGTWVRPGQGGPEGVSIVAGRDAVVIGETFHRLNVPNDVAWLPTQPACIELCLPSAEGLLCLETLRVPVPAEARAEGQRTFEAWNGVIGPELRARFRRSCGYDPERGPV